MDNVAWIVQPPFKGFLVYVLFRVIPFWLASLLPVCQLPWPIPCGSRTVNRITGQIELLEGWAKAIMLTSLARFDQCQGLQNQDILKTDNPLLIKSEGQAERALKVHRSGQPGLVMVVNGAPEPQRYRSAAFQQMLEPKPLIAIGCGKQRHSSAGTSRTPPQQRRSGQAFNTRARMVTGGHCAGRANSEQRGLFVTM